MNGRLVEPTEGYIEGGRGVELADMSIALVGVFAPPASREVAFHFLGEKSYEIARSSNESIIISRSFFLILWKMNVSRELLKFVEHLP